MTLSKDTFNRVKYALADPNAATELDQSLGLSAGDFWFVDSGHTNAADVATNAGTRDQPFATLDYAFSRVTASNGDVVVLMPGHAETTTAIAWDVAGIKVIGLGYGRNRPTLTATTAATDLINVTAANGILQNVRLVGAASGCTALLDGSSAATDFQLLDCELGAAATPVNLITWSGARPIIERLRVVQSADGLDYVVLFEAGVDQFIFDDWTVLCPNGIDNGLIGSGAFAHLGYLIDNMRVVGIDTLLVNFLSSTAAPPDGYFARGWVMTSAPITSMESTVAAGTTLGMAFGSIYQTDAVQTSGGRVPLTSAS